MGLVHSRILPRLCLIHAATVDPGMRGRRGSYSKWVLISPGVYSSGDLSNVIEGLSGLSFECTRPRGTKYDEKGRFTFHLSNGDNITTPFAPLSRTISGSSSEVEHQLYVRRCFVMRRTNADEGMRLAFIKLTRQVAHFKAIPKFGLATLAICPGSNDNAWIVVLDRHHEKHGEIRVDKVEGAAREADEDGAKGPALSLGHYIAPVPVFKGVSTFTIDLASIPASYKFPSMFITQIDEPANEVVLGPIRLKRGYLSHNLGAASKERIVNGCLDAVVEERQGLAHPEGSADIIIQKLASLAPPGSVNWRTICLCPGGNENEVLLVLNKKDWGTEAMRSVKLVKGQPSSGYSGVSHSTADGRHATSVAKRKESAPTVTEAKKARVTLESRVDGYYSVDGPDGERSISLSVSYVEEGIINLQLSFQGKDTYQLRASLNEDAGKNCWGVNSELDSESSPILLYTDLVETLNSLGESVERFQPEKGMYFCFDHGNGVAAHFGAESPYDKEAINVYFKPSEQSEPLSKN